MAEKVYYIVNPHGAIHDVSREHARMRLRQPGWRMATQAEVKKLRAAKGLQLADKPICPPWNPEPDAEPEIEEKPGAEGKEE